MKRVAAAVLLLALFGVTACGDDEREQLRSPHWRTRQDLMASLYPASAKRDPGEYNFLTLPQAHRTRANVAEDYDGFRRIVITETTDRRVFFKTYMFDMAAGREEAATGLREQLARILSREDHHGEDGASRIPLMLNVNRNAPWGDVRELLSACVDPPVRVEQVQIAVQTLHPVPGRRHPGPDRRIDLRVFASLQAEPRGDIELRLAREAEVTLLTVGKHTFRFQPGDRFDNESFVRHANQTWDAVADHLGAVARVGVANLRTDTATGVVWAYVVKTLDLLADEGITAVLLPDEKKQIEILPLPSG